MLRPKELRRKRLRARLTQAQLATKVRVHEHTVWRWEHGTRKIPPPTERLIELVFRDLESKRK
jgi:transcriptional regulator with XRE-family HTH domain